MGSEVMVRPAGEPGGLLGPGAGEGLWRPCGQGPARPCSAASPATGSVWKGKRQVEVSELPDGQLPDKLDGWACLPLSQSDSVLTRKTKHSYSLAVG